MPTCRKKLEHVSGRIGPTDKRGKNRSGFPDRPVDRNKNRPTCRKSRADFGRAADFVGVVTVQLPQALVQRWRS
eukprot:gene22322-biopygen7192